MVRALVSTGLTAFFSGFAAPLAFCRIVDMLAVQSCRETQKWLIESTCRLPKFSHHIMLRWCTPFLSTFFVNYRKPIVRLKLLDKLMRRAVGRWRCSSCQTASRQQSTSAATVAAAASTGRPRLVYAPISTPVQRYNALINRSAERGNLVAALESAAALQRTLVRLEQKPDSTTYEALAKAFAVHGLYREALRLLDDARAAGVEPDVGVFNQVLRVSIMYTRESCVVLTKLTLANQAHIVADQPLSSVFAQMASSHVEPNIYTRELIIEYFVHKKSVEPAVRALIELANEAPPAASTSKATYSEHHLNFSKVTQAVFDSVQRLICDVGETKLATGLLKAYQHSALQPVSDQVLYDMVEAGITHDDVSDYF